MPPIGIAPEVGECEQLLCLHIEPEVPEEPGGGFSGRTGDKPRRLPPGRYEQVGKIADVPQEGLLIHLKGFDFVKVFRTVDKESRVRHYAMYLTSSSADKSAESAWKRLKPSIGIWRSI